MLLNHLKPNFPINWKEKFLQNRKGYDPSGYRVGKLNINDKEYILVWNVMSDDVMEYYYDDVENNWVNLDMFLRSNKWYDFSWYPNNKIYFVNKLNGQFKSIHKTSKNETLIKTRSIKNKYQLIDLGHSSPIYLHRLLACIFIPNIDPDIFTVVNHRYDIIDKTLLNELEWITSADNNKKDRKERTRDQLLFKQFDKNMKYLKTYNYSEIINLGLKPNKLRKYAKNNTLYAGYNWEVIDKNLIEYLKLRDLDPIWWDDNYNTFTLIKDTKNLFINRCGLLRRGLNGYITCGNFTGDYYKITYYSLSQKKDINIPVHKLMLSTFCNQASPNFVVDHISTNKLDNRLINLKLCDQRENINNPITRQKHFIKDYIECYDLLGNLEKTFSNYIDASKYLNVTPTTVRISANKKTSIYVNNKIVCLCSNKEILDYKFSKVYYKLTKNGDLVKTFLILREDFKTKSEYNKVRRNYLNTLNSAPNGYIYIQGLENYKKLKK